MSLSDKKRIRDPTQWKAARQCTTPETKQEYIEKLIRSEILFALKPWQTGKKWSTMAKPSHFFAWIYFAEDFKRDGTILKYTKISWQYVQCEICVC